LAEVVVIGAGPAGLMAALGASQAGHRCTLIEAADHVGGMAASFEVAGQRVDLGSHRLHRSTDPDLLDLLRSLLGDDLQERERNGRIRLRDRWVRFPLRPVDLVRNLPPPFAAGAVGDALTAPLRRRRGESFAAAVAAGLGPTVAREFYAPYARKLYGVDAADLDAELARRRVSARSPGAIVRRLARVSQPSGRTFLYPRLGYGQIAERLAEAAVAAGVDVRLGTPVDRVAVTPRGVAVGGRSGLSRADVVLSSMPVASLARLLDPAPPAAVLAAAGQLRVRAMVLVYLVVDGDRYTPFDAHYLPGAESRITRLSEPKNYRHDRSDPAGRTVLCAELPCWPADPVWTMADRDLGALVARDLEAVGLPRPRWDEVEVRRLRSVYPVYELATMADRRTVEAWASSLDRVVSLGRQGLGVPDNLHHVLSMGRDAADAVGPDGTLDQARWRRSLDRFASHVVED
jgi:protoporphyrinogen oxidase